MPRRGKLQTNGLAGIHCAHKSAQYHTVQQGCAAKHNFLSANSHHHKQRHRSQQTAHRHQQKRAKMLYRIFYHKKSGTPNHRYHHQKYRRKPLQSVFFHSCKLTVNPSRESIDFVALRYNYKPKTNEQTPATPHSAGRAPAARF